MTTMTLPSVRGLVKTSAARAVSWSRADRLIGAVTGLRHRPLVLGYHRVVEDFAASVESAIPANLTSIRMLEQQLDWVGRRFRFVTLDELGERVERRDAEPVAAVTFDDGYRDVYEVAFPVLSRKGIPAAVFVITEMVGTLRPPRCDRLYVLVARAFSRRPSARARLAGLIEKLELHAADGRRFALPETALATTVHLLRTFPRVAIERIIESLETEVDVPGDVTRRMLPMTWDMLAAMKAAGTVIGSHTRRHLLLPLEQPDVIADELSGARAEIERRLGGTVRHFAYPDGQFNRASAAAVAAAGYRFAFTTCSYRDPEFPLLTHPRLMLWERASLGASGEFSPAIMSCLAHGVFEVVRRCEHEHRG